MPQKTKKEKKAAEAHRKTATLHVSQTSHTPYHLQTPHPALPQFQFRLTRQETTHGTPYSGELTNIAHDLTKTIILAFIAVSFEFLLARIIR